MEYLDPKGIKFVLNDNMLLDLYYQDKEYHGIKSLCSFPLSEPYKYVCLVYGDEKVEEIGIIEDIEALNEEAKKALLSDIKMRYFMPEIIKIYKRDRKRRMHNFEVLTTAGNKTIHIRDIIYNLTPLSNGDLLIKDVDENYYLIKDYEHPRDKHMRYIKGLI